MNPRLNSSGSCFTLFLFDNGKITLEMLWFLQAVSFSLTPPMPRTSPSVVISPVIARLAATGLLIAADTSDANKLTPADGPSFGYAPIGTCR